MADVIIVYPKTTFAKKDFRPLLPLAPLYISVYLVQKGYEVKILDERVDADWMEDLKREIRSEKPVCVGISSMTGPQIAGGLKAARLIKSLDPDIPVVWGGVHPSLLPEQTAAHELVDLVVIGEGEHSFPEVVDTLRTQGPLETVPGILYKQNGRLRKTAPRDFLDLNELPRLPYQLLDVHRYTNAPFLVTEKSLPIITSRGCPYRCEYCYTWAYNRRTWRARRPEKVLSDIQYIVDTYGIHSIYLLDDEFFIDRKRVNDIGKLILDRGLPLTYHNANIRVNEVLKYDLQTLRMLRRAGFVKVFVGVESGSNEVLRRIRKDITAEDVLQANQKLKEADITPIYSFMGGFPFETKQDVQKTLFLAVKLLDENPASLFYGLSLYSPFPGTPLFDTCSEQGMKPAQALEEWVGFQYDTLNFKPFRKEDLTFIEEAALFSQFIHPRLMHLEEDAWWVQFLKRLYSSLIRFRIRKRYYGFRIESKAHKLFKSLKKSWQDGGGG
jgi:radical SAM superfamily enzyme YgiQ (UPF0313 family)